MRDGVRKVACERWGVQGSCTRDERGVVLTPPSIVRPFPHMVARNRDGEAAIGRGYATEIPLPCPLPRALPFVQAGG